jgi:hypothetical protein
MLATRSQRREFRAYNIGEWHTVHDRRCRDRRPDDHVSLLAPIRWKQRSELGICVCHIRAVERVIAGRATAGNATYLSMGQKPSSTRSGDANFRPRALFPDRFGRAMATVRLVRRICQAGAMTRQRTCACSQRGERNGQPPTRSCELSDRGRDRVAVDGGVAREGVRPVLDQLLVEKVPLGIHGVHDRQVTSPVPGQSS